MLAKVPNLLGFSQQTTAFLCLAIATVCSVVFSMAFGLVASEAADAGVAGNFAGMWTEMQAIAEGAPGKILMLLMVLGVIFFATVKPNLVGFAGCVVSVLVLANASDIIDNSLTANLSDLAPVAIEAPVSLK